MSEGKQTYGKPKLLNRGLMRLALVVCACACVVAGILMLINSNTPQARTEQVVTYTQTTAPKADALLILSYAEDQLNTPLERDGVLDVMGRSDVDVDIMYMDALNNTQGSGAEAAWRQLMTAKLDQHGPYSVVICADDEALDFVRANHDQMFPETPVVFFGVNNFANANTMAKTGYATGMVEQAYIGSTMQLVAKLQPDADKYLVIVDDTPTGVGDKAQFASALSTVPNMSAEYVNASKLTRGQLANRVARAGEDTIILYLDAYNDVDGNVYTVPESAAFLASTASRPVFHGSIGGVGDGLCGSGFVDFEADGQQAAQLAIKILNGAPPASLPVVMNSTGGYVFDADVMGKYGISANDLPSDAVVINESGISLHGLSMIIGPVLLIILGLILAILFFYSVFRRSEKKSREVTAQHNVIKQRLYTDMLTEKPTVQWLTTYSDQADADKVRSVVEVDPIGFNDINEAYGLEAGDSVILQMAERLDKLNKEFLVRTARSSFLLGYANELTESCPELNALELSLSTPYVVDDNTIQVETCLGVVNRKDDVPIEDLVSFAEQATRQAKLIDHGRKIAFYDRDMKRALDDKLEITAYLKNAINNDGFVVYYQPQVDIETNDVIGYEALVRLKNDAYPPTQFIPVAEMTGLIVDIDRIVTAKAVQQLATWKKRNKRLRPVSINYSYAQLKDEGYVDFLLEQLSEHEVPPSLIKIEITEAIFMSDPDRADKLLDRLMAAGVTIALDDFGIGYTSISRILSIPADIIQIDKTLVDTYMSTGREELIGNLCELVHGLGKKVSVEGIETREQADICRKLGCDMVQGFYFSKPLLPERAAQFKPSRSDAA